MNKTYQPFIIKKSEEILEILKEDIVPSDYAKEALCGILTEKHINGKLNENDDISMIFDSEEEILRLINECQTHDELIGLIEKGLVGVYEDENNEELFFLTDAGKLYVEQMLKNN
jgi:hypothetical protein